MRVEVIKDGCTPVKKHKTDAGWDLICSDSCSITKTQSRPVGTGVKVEIPAGFCGLVVPRSSLGIAGMSLTNTIGVIDSDYRGEIIVHVTNNSKRQMVINKGDRFAQLVLVPTLLDEVVVVDSLENTDRGEGGFGSTGIKAEDKKPVVKKPVVKKPVVKKPEKK